MCLIGDACIINGSKRRQLAAFKLDKRRQCVGVACIINAANSWHFYQKRHELIFSTTVSRHKASAVK
jgi:hypothetical protein